jgi:hypothetical protein
LAIGIILGLIRRHQRLIQLLIPRTDRRCFDVGSRELSRTEEAVVNARDLDIRHRLLSAAFPICGSSRSSHSYVFGARFSRRRAVGRRRRRISFDWFGEGKAGPSFALRIPETHPHHFPEDGVPTPLLLQILLPFDHQSFLFGSLAGSAMKIEQRI